MHLREDIKNFYSIGFQKVSECMKLAAELLGRRTSSDTDCAATVISEGLSISSYSEKLLKMKVDALLMVCINIKSLIYVFSGIQSVIIYLAFFYFYMHIF